MGSLLIMRLRRVQLEAFLPESSLPALIKNVYLKGSNTQKTSFKILKRHKDPSAGCKLRLQASSTANQAKFQTWHFTYESGVSEGHYLRLAHSWAGGAPLN